MMIRRLTIVGLVSLLLLTNSLFAVSEETPPTDEEVSAALNVMLDCVSASLVTSCTDSGITLPCSSVSIEKESRLPLRIAYFLADPSEYVKAMAPSESSGGFFAALMSLLNNVTENPLVSAVYVVMATREYIPGGSLVNGSISFGYPEGATLDDVLAIWSTRAYTDQSIKLRVDMTVIGTSFARPLSLYGLFEMSVDRNGDIVVKSIDVYTINGYGYQNGEFRM